MSFYYISSVIAAVSWLAKSQDIEHQSTSVQLPTSLQQLLDALDDHALIQVAYAAVSVNDYSIFNQVASYMITDWEDTHCNWLNDELPHSIATGGWQYIAANAVVTGPLSVYCDIQETFAPFCVSCMDELSMPHTLYHTIAWLAESGNDCLARIKYVLWTKYQVEWNEDFTTKLGFATDDELFSALGQALYDLILSESQSTEQPPSSPKRPRGGKGSRNGGRNKRSTHKPIKLFPIIVEDPNIDDNTADSCSLTQPVDLVNPFYEAISAEFNKIFNELNIGGITAVASFGVQVCVQSEESLCFGAGFGFSVDEHGNACIFEQSAANYSHSTDPQISFVGAKYVMEFSFYDNTDAVHQTELSREVSNDHGDWITDLSLIYDNNNIPVGITFAAEVYLTNTGIQLHEGVGLGAITLDKIAELSHPLLTTNLSKKATYYSGSSYSYFHLVGYLIIISIVIYGLVVAAKLYSNKKVIKLNPLQSEYTPLI